MAQEMEGAGRWPTSRRGGARVHPAVRKGRKTRSNPAPGPAFRVRPEDVSLPIRLASRGGNAYCVRRREAAPSRPRADFASLRRVPLTQPTSPPPNRRGLGVLAPTLSVVETWGFGFSVLLFWVVVAPAVHVEVGPSALAAWIPATLAGIVITLQVRRLALARTDAAGGSPVYVAGLWSDRPWVARWTGWAYFHSWAIVPPVLAWVLADVATDTLAMAGVSVPPLAIQLVVLGAVYGLAFTGIRALSIVHLAFLVPSLGLVALFGVQGFALFLLPVGSGVALAAPEASLTFPGWLPWLATYFAVAYTTYGIETAAAFTADSPSPRRTLRALPVAAALALPIMVGGSWLLHRASGLPPGAHAMNAPSETALLEEVAGLLWGAATPALVTFMVASCCLLACASSVAITPRVGWQLARDGVFPPLLGRLNGAGVPRVALGAAAVLALLHAGLGPGEMLLVGGASWVGFWALMHLGLWRRRGDDAVLWPHLALLLGLLELAVLGVGGWMAGGGYVLAGLLVPTALVALDPLARRLPDRWNHPPFRPLGPGRRMGREALEVGLLLGLVLLTLSVGWLMARQVGDAPREVLVRVYVITTVVMAFLGVAWGGWTTLRRLAQVEAARARSEDILATASDPVLLVDLDGRILSVNPAGRSLLETGEGPLEGRRLRTLLPSLPEDPAAWGSWSEHEVRLGRRSRTLEVAARRRAGPGPEEYTVTLRDLTEREAGRRALEESEERVKLALGAARAGIWDLDLRTGFAVTTRQWNLLVDLPPESPGLTFDDWERFLHPDDRVETLRAFEDHLAGGAPIYEAEHRIRLEGMQGTGEWRWVLSRGRVVERDPEGTPLRVLGVSSDLSERKSLEVELLHARKLEAVGQLAGGIAHDFNNALTAILGTAELLLESMKDPDPETRRDVETIRTSAEHAAGITRQLLAFSRRQQLRPQVVDVREALERIALLLGAFLEEHIALSVHVRGEEPLHCWTDPAQLEQALMNLAINARDALEAGGALRLEAASGTRPPPTSPAASGGPQPLPTPARDSVVLTVADTGTGIDPAARDRIFEPFFTTKPSGKGTGLGLAMVYGFVTQSGGTVEVESEVGAGTTFRIHLPRLGGSVPPGEDGPTRGGPPLAVGDPEGGLEEAFGGGTGRPEVSLAGSTGGWRGSGTVLLAEDEPGVRGLVSRTLIRAGLQVLEAEDGAGALALARENRGRIDLLITDMVMPRMGGAELARRIQHLQPGLPVLFMSGYPSRPSAHFQGSVHPPFLQKPFRPRTLIEEVRRILEGGDDAPDAGGQSPPPAPGGSGGGRSVSE